MDRTLYLFLITEELEIKILWASWEQVKAINIMNLKCPLNTPGADLRMEPQKPRSHPSLLKDYEVPSHFSLAFAALHCQWWGLHDQTKTLSMWSKTTGKQSILGICKDKLNQPKYCFSFFIIIQEIIFFQRNKLRGDTCKNAYHCSVQTLYKISIKTKLQVMFRK